MVNSHLESLIYTTKSILRKPMNLALTAMAVATIYSCGKDSDDPQVPDPDPIEQKLFINYNGEDPEASGRAYTISDKDTTAISNLVPADQNGNIKIEFNVSQLNGSGSLTSKNVNSVDLLRIFNELNVAKYEFTNVSTSTSSNSNPNLTVNETSYMLTVNTNSIFSSFEGFKDGLKVVGGEVGDNASGKSTFYDLDPNNTNPSITLDSLNIVTSNPDLGKVQLENFTIDRVREINVIHPNVDNSGNKGIIEVSALDGTSPERRYRILIENVATGEMLTPIGVGDFKREFELDTGTYNFTLEDDGVDFSYDTQGDSGWFPTLVENVVISAGANDNLEVMLNSLPNNKQLYIKTFNEDYTEANNINIEIIDANTNEKYVDHTTDFQGKFIDVPSGATLYARISRDGDYGMETENFTLSTTNNIVSDVIVELGLTSFSKKNLENNSPMTVNQLNITKPDEWPFQIMSTKKAYQYIPPSEVKEALDNFYTEFYAAFGVEYIKLDQPLPVHSGSSSGVYVQFQPLRDQPNREVFDGQIGIFTESLNGTGTTRFTKDLGGFKTSVSINTSLAGADIANAGHEGARVSDISEVTTAQLGYSPSSFSANRVDNQDPRISPGDLPIINQIYDIGFAVVHDSFTGLYGEQVAYLIRPAKSFFDPSSSNKKKN